MKEQQAENNIQNNKNSTPANQQESGSNYNLEHSGNLPDYGINDVDPNANLTSSANKLRK